MVHTFSTVIPVRDNHGQLRDCLDAFRRQTRETKFDVIVVDDGSSAPVPADLGRDYPFPLEVTRQVPLGIAAARNTGIMHARGEIIVFVDSDVTVDRDFLGQLEDAVEAHPEDGAFQANLAGGVGNLVERMEGLRLTATLAALEDGDGHVRYANTSAFAIRRSLVDPGKDFFDPAAVRGEDTLMLADLLRRRLPPRLVARARAVHRPRVPLLKYLRKHFLIGYYTTPARDELRKWNPDALLKNGGRRRVFRQMLAATSQDPANLLVLLLVVPAHLFERLGRAAHRVFGLRHERRDILSLPVDCVRESELVARILNNAARGTGMKITYLTAWTLVQSDRDPAMRRLFRSFDICYPDGMGVVLCSIFLGGRRLHKVTANNFISALCEDAAARSLPVALVGAGVNAIAIAADKLRVRYPGINLVGLSHGYLSQAEEAGLRESLIRSQPRIVIVGMGQPIQENWTCRTSEALPGTVFLCVGGLFDYIIGAKPTPPGLVRKFGMEWLYILLMRPKQFWRRYVFGLPMLALLVIREFATKILVFKRPGNLPRT